MKNREGGDVFEEELPAVWSSHDKMIRDLEYVRENHNLIWEDDPYSCIQGLIASIPVRNAVIQMKGDFSEIEKRVLEGLINKATDSYISENCPPSKKSEIKKLPKRYVDTE